jgi:hypothetical protein
MLRVWIVTIWLSAASVMGVTAQEWMSRDAAARAAEQLANEMAALPRSGGRSAEALRPGAEQMVEEVRRGIDKQGLAGITRLAPPLADLRVPPLAHPILNTMARFSLCRLPFRAVSQDATLDADAPNQRVAAVIGVLWIDSALAYLRVQYYASGGTEDQISQQLSLPALTAIATRVRTDVQVGQAVATECAPALQTLMQ